MASLVDLKITIDGKALYGLFKFTVRQNISSHHTFDLFGRIDTIDNFKVSVETFMLEKAQDFIGKRIKIEINHIYKNSSTSGYNTLFSGIILEVEGIKCLDAFNGLIVFRGASPDVLMNGPKYSRSFKEQTLTQIVKEVVKNYPLNLFEKTQVTSRNLGVLPYIVQYNETNFEFIQRLAHRFGEWFLITGNSQFFFGNLPDQKTELTLGIDLIEFSYSMKLDSLGFIYSAYDYNTCGNISKSSLSYLPELDQYLKKSITISDVVFDQEGYFFYNYPMFKGLSEHEVDDAIKTDKLGRIARLNLAKGSSENSELTLGGIIQVKGISETGSLVKTINFGEFRIITLEHSCDETGSYVNHFEATPAILEVPPYTNPLIRPICETQSAVVIDTNDPEGLGRIKVRFFWQGPKGETPWIRLVTPYAGNNKGIFFIPEVGEEVLVAFEGRNAENPYVVGSLYNGKDSPNNWESDKNLKKGIRTKSGHTIEFNDENGKEEIVIYDKDQINMIRLSSCERLMTISCKGDLKIEAQNIDIKVEKNYSLDVAGKIDVSSQQDNNLNS